MKIDLYTEGNVSFPYKNIPGKFFISNTKKICGILKLKNTSLTLIICDNSYIEQINKEYRKKNKPTDVISFSYREIPFPQIDLKYEPLGDIYISIEKAVENAVSYETILEDEIIRLLIHGILHLIGYDHEKSTEEKKTMTEKEEYIKNNL